MNTTKCAGIVALMLLVGVGFLFLTERRASDALRAENDALRQQASLARDEHQRLLEENNSMTERAANDQRELMQLRSKAAALTRAEKEIAGLKSEIERTPKPVQSPRQTDQMDNPFDRNHGPGAGVRVQSAKHLGLALLMHASDNQGQFPNSLEDALPQLSNEFNKSELESVSQQAGQFELLFRGTRDELDKLPPESTIIVREKRAWMDQHGMWCKAYTMADGSSTIRSSERNDFEQWEQLRIPKPRQP
jgi:hypothetical protein